MRYYIHIFGCQMNYSDAERAQAVLDRLGYQKTNQEAQADIIVVLACSIRQSAMDRIYGRIVKWQKIKKQKRLLTILTGCYLKSDYLKLKSIFDIVLSIKKLNALPKLISQTYKIKISELDLSSDYLKILPHYNSRFQAYLPISTGCNKYCSYCVVPFTRGKEISRPLSDIINEFKALIKKGYREITLLGQNVNSYGWDFQGVLVNFPLRKVYQNQYDKLGKLTVKKRRVDNPINFSQLLERLANQPGKFWLRFLTCHPYDLDTRLLNVIASHKKITPYIHLPVQSGSDKILKSMNRLYSIKHYMELIENIRRLIPEAVISTDIIVGFCGETLSDFQKTCRLVAQVKFDMAYIAQYSARPGTASAQRRDTVSKKEKEQRERKLNDILKKVALLNNKKLLGTKQTVLFESCKNNFCYGRTYGFKNIRVFSKTDLSGKFKQVKVTQVTPWHLSGKLL